MKVAISGAHGTGKTTLVEAIASADPTVVVVPEIPRLLLADLGGQQELQRGNNTWERQLTIMVAQMAYEAEAASEPGVTLTDRGIADHWAYSAVVLGTSNGVSPLVEESVRRWSRTYDQVFYLNPEFALEEDGVREGGLDFQGAIDDFLRAFYSSLGISVISLAGTVEQRRDALLNHLSKGAS